MKECELALSGENQGDEHFIAGHSNIPAHAQKRKGTSTSPSERRLGYLSVYRSQRPNFWKDYMERQACQLAIATSPGSSEICRIFD